MRTFTDTRGNTWEIAITLGAAKRLRDRAGIDLLRPEAKGPDGVPGITALAIDEYLQAEAIATLIEPQMAAANIAPEAVPDIFDGATLAAAQAAFWEEIENFFQSLGHTARAQMVSKQRQTLAAAMRLATDRLASIDPETLAAGAMSTSSPAEPQ